MFISFNNISTKTVREMDMITFPDAGSGNIKKIKKICFEKNRCGRVRRTRNQIGVVLYVMHKIVIWRLYYMFMYKRLRFDDVTYPVVCFSNGENKT